MINERSRDDIARMVQDAVDSETDVAVGASVPDRKGFFYEPTVLSGSRRTPPSSTRRSSGLWRRWSNSTATMRQSAWQMTRSTG